MSQSLDVTKTVPAGEKFVFDYGEADTYPTDLYNFSDIANGVETLDDVSAEQIARFHDQGYLVVHNAFTGDEVQSALDGLLYLISGQHPDFTGLMFENKAKGVSVDNLPAEEKQDYLRKFMWFVEYDERLKALSDHPKLLDVLTRMIGETPELFQDMALLKPPRIGREKPWHQDHAYFNLPLETTVVGVWIALDEATVANGCMVINPGSHRAPIVHFQQRDWQICDTHVNNSRALAVPLKPGGALFFHSYIQHGTPANLTEQRRRAVQYHYKPASVAKIGEELRLATFGAEGKDVTC